MKKLNINSIQIFKLLFFLGLLISTTSCTNKNTITPSLETKLEGVWKQTNFFRLANNDTILKNNSKVQHKIYLDGYLMWTSDAGTDNLEWHGYGTYTVKNDTLVETLTSMSIPLKEYTSIYPIIIEKTGNSLKQIIHYQENNINYQNIEIYKKLN